MNEQQNQTMTANTVSKPTNAVVKREKILMGESSIGERYLGEGIKGSTFFETAHGVFADFGSAEKFGMDNIKSTRWLVADRITRENGLVSYDFLTKPRHARRYQD